MCPLRYFIVVLSLGFILICVVFGASYAPDFVIEAEKKRKEENKKWYETLWDFAWGKYLINIWREAVQKEKEKDKLKDIDNAPEIKHTPIKPEQMVMNTKKME
mmetsp:Transcript_69374/g.62244  ORF Transcript_69374/g.62244 Transcript_69374/m.62244 type:complete len:103 (-) Transcript_69374:173-481(-)|eukprot:CAMPEP_0201581002 /NCGR_PEP_ID=MMETSP0190_2-20130828/60541_1 /ASSEMBLY_ACC=CAM_ASM_000263 /TAXON_ID=37353 /ORGANISM="Rosalina sp." /LENGTH=102 /DNA_ID=CAMNT_0048018127 /DNA_START=35 /DNA_END=343 /DNA_ORIENTATION=+